MLSCWCSCVNTRKGHTWAWQQWRVAWPEGAARCTKHRRDLCVNAATLPAASWSIITHQTHPSQRGTQHADFVAHGTRCVRFGAANYNLGAAWSASTDMGSDAVHGQLLTAGGSDANTVACSTAGNPLLNYGLERSYLSLHVASGAHLSREAEPQHAPCPWATCPPADCATGMLP